MRHVTASKLQSERGQSMVLFAVLLPLMLFIAVLSVDVGNWWVHKRHIQTQVDAAALAAGPIFRQCFRDAASGNTQIADEAIKYAGDTRRDSLTLNRQVQEPNDVYIALNSAQYWESTDGANPGYNLDYTINGDEEASKPCATRFLDVKATDDLVAPLWGRIQNWRDFPKSVSPKTHAKIEARDIQAQSGMLPWAVPETDPRAVAALFVNEDDGSVFDYQMLMQNEDPLLPWTEWSTTALQEQIVLDSGRENTGVVILVSKEDPTPATTGTLSTICNQAPSLVACYGGSSQTSGISFIHAYKGGYNGSLKGPQARQVELFAVNCSAADLSAPYFTLDGGCSATIQAVIDFGVTGDPQPAPTCALVEGMKWTPAGPDSSRGVWTGSVSLAAASGRNQVNLQAYTGPRRNGTCGNPGQHPNNPVLNKVAVPYVATGTAGQRSGPVQYLKLKASHADGTPVGDANSVERNDPGNQSYNYVVTVGLPKPLSIANYADPPLPLRLGGPSGSQNQAWDCDDQIQYRIEIEKGCQTTYRENFADLDGDGDKEWRNFFCTGYSNTDLPPQTFDPVPPPDCIRAEPGDKEGQQRDGLHDRFETPCTSNNWPDTQAEADIFFGPNGGGYGDDPRYVTLIVADDTAFPGPGNSDDKFPVKYFAGFYVTGWDLQQNQTEGCPDIDGPGPYKGNDCHPIYGCSDDKNDNGDVWGYYVEIVAFSGAGVPGDLCAFGVDPAACVAILVE